ncbi:MAG TPA: methyltransferase domain-containing protein [Candidatus Saccharimonadales bacterium]|nr:methyltransferase domain-containing protein [Candidatus Saccharimonadales bacterium]
MHKGDKEFVDVIPQIYEKYLVPLIFEQYAHDLINRLRKYSPTRVLEIAAGTGVVTRLLASELSENVSIVATDLNQAMLDEGIKKGTSRPIEWRQADGMQLPFEQESFDAVVCQFGAMFLPDKVKFYQEVQRVLTPQGVFIFTVWDRVEANTYAAITQQTLNTLFPNDPPSFLSRVPYGYSDKNEIKKQLGKAGFKKIHSETVTKQTHATSAHIPAYSYTQGVPVRNEIVARGMSLNDATDAVEKAMIKHFGHGEIHTTIQAIVITAEK